ncbi:Fanconi anemia group M protein [Heptranchias perlo]|uniref:Fanconi anemia group M protein n=1 Tax=Heptranchias perlo TaxID=212740 RepID=UPI00355A0BF1
MSGGRQRTLFQSWGAKPVSQQAASQPQGKRRSVGPSADYRRGRQQSSGEAAVPAPQDGFEDGEDDDVLLVAVFEAERSLGGGGPVSVSQRPETRAEAATLPGFDLSSGDVWIYPTNYPVRAYQFDMARVALFHNTLVCLPTSLGKTFIAAVVMYNFYRWYPSGKIVFMAPTKPLVAQQIEACYKVMGIPQDHMAEMTGHTQALNRQNIWNAKRIFFLTPQVMMNDLFRGACPAADVKCLVVDEAHKALGNYAYCQVVKELCNYTRQFRVLALSATPGSDTKAVQQVLSNLMIAHIEVRSEDSLDIQPYSHQRHVEKFVVPLGTKLIAIQSLYLQVLEAFTRRLLKAGALLHKDIANLTKFQIVLSREQFRKNPPMHIVGAQRGMMEGDYALCISLYHGYELLLQMGMRSLYSYLEGIMDGSKGMIRARNELRRNTDFMEIYEQLKAMFASGSSLFCSQIGSENRKQFIYSHPKLQKLEEVVVDHFQSWAESGGNVHLGTGPNTSGKKIDGLNTRVMIFSSFRDSVQEIAEMLNKHQPLVRVMTFVGHSSGKNTKGFTQKEQLEVMKCFREGGYNTLVSTCVGEEGLDIGEVDLIICFDAQKSPIRLVQRMGRTGRKRQGRIVVLLAEGREERTYNQSQCNKRSIYKTILGNKSFHLYTNSPRMVPNGLNPVAHKMHITTGEYESSNVSRHSSKQGRKSSIALSGSFIYRRSSVIKQTKSKEDGLLTPEEFEIWDRKFRLKNDDLGSPRLVPIPFEFAKDEPKTVEHESGTIHELSLSEWSLWQSRPFSTHLVDHSDRCQHFISIMDMIELMRQEENDCSYSLEIMSYLNMDDIFEATPTLQPQVTSISIANNQDKPKMDQLMKPRCERKKCISNSVKQNSNLRTLTNEDEQYSIFNISKMKRRKVRYSSSCPCAELETANSKETQKSSHCVSRNCRDKEATFISKGILSNPSEQICQPEGEIEVDINNVQEATCFSGSDMREILESHMKISLNVNSAASRSTNTERKSVGIRKKENGECHDHEPINDYMMRELIAAGTRNLCSKYRESNSSDSGHNNSLVNETAIDGMNLSKLFYHPDLFVTQDHSPQQRSSNADPGRIRHSYSPDVEHPNYDSARQVPTSVEMVLGNVKSFLTTSPPSLERFHFWEEVNYEENRSQSDISKAPPVNVLKPDQGDNQFLGGSPPVNSKSTDLVTCREPVTITENLSNHVNSGSSPSWDDLFDNDIEEDLEQDCEAQPSVNQEEFHDLSYQYHNSTDKNKSRKNKTLKDSINDAPFTYEKSLPLFEDEPSLDLSTLRVPNYSKRCVITQDVSGLGRQSTVLDEPLQNAQANKSLENGENKHDVTRRSLFDKSIQRHMLSENLCDGQYRPVADVSNIYNCSDELFSVNFDLGFSFEDIDEKCDVLMTNTISNKATEFSEHLAGKSSSENTELSKIEPDECTPEIQEKCINMVTSKLFAARSKVKRDCSTPVSLKHTPLKPSKLGTFPHNEKQCLTTQEVSLLSPICQPDHWVSSTFSPTSASISTPKGKSSSLNLCAMASINPLFRNDLVISQNPVLSNVAEDPEAVKKGTLSESAASPNTSGSIVKCSTSEMHGKKSFISNKQNIFHKILESPIDGGCNSESEDEVIRRPSKKVKLGVLESPEVTSTSDIDSPFLADRKPRKTLNLRFTDSEDDDDFRATSTENNKGTKLSRNIHRSWRKHAARQFLDEEAELSSEGAENVSSDEDDSDNINDASLKHFINDASQLSQVISDGDMQEIYLKSVRSPNIHNKKKMVYNKNELTIFSQIPEQDETYMEDSFCVREEDEENNQAELCDDEVVNFDLLNNTPIGGIKQYVTRHRARTKMAETEHAKGALSKKKKGSRIVVLHDSSEEEQEVNMNTELPGKDLVQNSKSKQTTEVQKIILCSSKPSLGGGSFKKPFSKMILQQTASVEKGIPSEPRSLDRSCAVRLNLQASVSETLDFQIEQKHSRCTSILAPEITYNSMQDKTQSKPQMDKLHCINSVMEKSLVDYDISTFSRPSETLCKGSLVAIHHPVSLRTIPLTVLVDSREISSGPNLVSSLRIKHSIKAEICSLNGCDYIVSNRMAVERKSLSEFANSVNRSKLVDRIQHLQAMFERVCVIVEKDRTKPGDASKIFQRTRYYDGLLSALTIAGIRILFSSSQEETAGLLAELARVEERKNAAITVPLEVRGLRQQILQFYLSIPDISYITALNLCHHFNSVKEVANSSVDEIAARAKVGHRRAEEIYRYLHYVFDPQMVPDHLGQTNRKQSL